MTIHPKQSKDLMLAPVAAEIDINLQRLRDKSVPEVQAQVGLELNAPSTNHDRDERSELVLRQALRDVDMHGWTAGISDDGCRVHLEGGSVSIDLGLSASITEYIEDGVTVPAQLASAAGS